MSIRPVFSVCLIAALSVACSSTPARGALAAAESQPFVAPPLAFAHVATQDDAASDDGDGHGFFGTLLWYIPNRFLDVFDIVRARVRLGPGIAVGARATELADVFLGTYATVYVGLPGPRGRVFPRLPLGFESKSGAEASLADVTVEGGIGPDYGDFEFGVGLQALLVGFDVGVEPFEILDLVVGLLTFDPADDDF